MQSEADGQPCAAHYTAGEVIVYILMLTVAGCSSIGPGTVTRDRLHYSCALSDSWKEQLLVNIVKTRYEDSPAFLELSSVVSGYTLETGLGASGQYSPPGLRGDSFMGGAVSAKFTDRPTISYTPMTGEKFARSLLSPVPLDAVWSVVQGGVPADFLLGLTVQSMGGHYNLGLYGGEIQKMDPEFARMLQVMRSLQEAHAFDPEIISNSERAETWMRFPAPGSFTPSLVEQAAELKVLLNIPAGTERVRVTYGTRNAEPGVVAVRTRSLMQIISTLGAGVQIPVEHATAGEVLRLEAADLPFTFKVHSGKDKPKRRFVAVPYEGYWYWIEPDDFASKRTLAAVTLLMHFLESGSGKSVPILTIPAN